MILKNHTILFIIIIENGVYNVQIVKKTENEPENTCFKKGVVSVSFRDKTPEEIVESAAESGLECIEWGSDVHVPFNNLENAREVFEKTAQKGLFVSSYGTYFGIDRDGLSELNCYMETAKALHTDKMRIWPPGKPSKKIIADGEWKSYVKKTSRLAQVAEKSGIVLMLECHPFTLTDDYNAALEFFEAVNQPNLRLCWQPNQYKSLDYNLKSIKKLKRYIENVHVFNWDKTQRYPLEDGIEIWKSYLKEIEETSHCLLLEFMHDDKFSSLPQTAAALDEIIKKGEADELYTDKRLRECF